MSIQRAIRRRRARKSGTTWPTQTMPFRECADGYDALHPRKGWRHVSTARLRAQFLIGQMREAIARRMGRA